MNVNNFGPFNSEVWGNVSNWIIAIITAITGYLIYKTFLSQINVQKNQQRITDIESERFRTEHKPNLKLNLVVINNTPFEHYIQSDIQIILIIDNNDYKNLNFRELNSSIIRKALIVENYNTLELPIDYVYHPTEYKIHFQVIRQTLDFQKNGSILNFELEYDDVIGNSYSQEFLYIFQNKVNSSMIKNPRRIFK